MTPLDRLIDRMPKWLAGLITAAAFGVLLFGGVYGGMP